MPTTPMTMQRVEAYPLGGMDQRHRVKPTTAARIRDMTWTGKSGWATAGGYDQITPDDDEGDNAFDTSAKIRSLHYFTQKGGTLQWLVWETETGTFRYFNGSTSPTTASVVIHDELNQNYDAIVRSRYTQEAPGARSLSAVYGDNLYLVNGIDEPIVFDGIKAMRAGFDRPPPPPSPTESNKEGSGTNHEVTNSQLGVGAYSKTCARRYKRTWVNERGQESPASEPSEMLVWDNGASTRVAPTLHLSAGPSWACAQRIYATADIMDADGEPLDRGTGNNYYFHSEIPDTRTEVFLDIKPDGMLGNLLIEEDLGAWPTGGDTIAVFKNTVFVGDDNGLAFSRAGNPEVFPPGNRFDLHGGKPTCLLATRNALVVWKERAIYVVKGDPVSGFYLQTLFTNVGTSARDGAAYVPKLGVVFISEQGVFLLQGALENTGTPTQLVPLHTQIPDLFATVNVSALVDAKAAAYYRDRELWLCVPTGASHVNDTVLVYHYEIGAWSFRENYPVADIIVTEDHRGYLMFGSHDTSHRGIHVYSRGFGDKDGVSIEPLYETSPLSLGVFYEGVGSTFAVMAEVVGYGINEITLGAEVNRRNVDVWNDEEDDSPTRQQRYPSDEEGTDRSANLMMPVLGEVSWGDAAKWGEHRKVAIRWNVSTVGEPPAHEIGLTFSATSRMELISWGLGIELGSRRKILPLTEIYGGA